MKTEIETANNVVIGTGYILYKKEILLMLKPWSLEKYKTTSNYKYETTQTTLTVYDDISDCQ